jgi:energy-coupling factor transporter ATP-binding protein EcfA2
MHSQTNGSPMPSEFRKAESILADNLSEIINSAGSEKLLAIEQASEIAHDAVRRRLLDEQPATIALRGAIIQSGAMGECGVDPVQDALDRGENDVTRQHRGEKYQKDSEARAAAKASAEAEGKKLSQTDKLIAVGACAELYRTREKETYADITVDDRRETWAVGSREFRQHLRHEYYKDTGGGAPSSDAMATALATLDAKARFSGSERPVHLRAAALGGNLYIDLCDNEGGAVEVTKYRWRYVREPAVRFRRTRGMKALPMPTRDCSISALARFIPASGDDFMLIVAWLIAAMRPSGPYPALVLTGEQGGGKSTLAAMLRGLVDPHTAAHRAPPRNTHDLYVAATNNYVLALDNLSGVAPDLADAMCRLSTGGGFAARKLYTDDEEALFSGQRPIILTGINDIASRSDLADRALFVRLGPLDDGKRRPESEFWAEFERAQPAIFGALLTAMVAGLRNLPDTRLDKLPRMADFALWIAACESALPWEAGEFLAAYNRNRNDAAEIVLGADPLADALQRFMEGRSEYPATASDLLAQLNAIVPDHVKRDRTWPQAANGLSGRLTRLAPALKSVGITIERWRAGASDRTKRMRIVRRPPSE